MRKNYLVVLGGQKFRSLVSDQSFSKKTPQMKNKNVATQARIDVVFHGHLINWILISLTREFIFNYFKCSRNFLTHHEWAFQSGKQCCISDRIQKLHSKVKRFVVIQIHGFVNSEQDRQLNQGTVCTRPVKKYRLRITWFVVVQIERDEI